MADQVKDYVDIELSRPLQVDGVDVQKLRMREPLVQDQLVAGEIKGSAAMQEIILIANLCEMAPDDIKRLPLRDYKKVQDAFLGFTE